MFFIGATILFIAAFVVLALPAVLMARRLGRTDSAKRFLIAALVSGLVCAFIGLGSRGLVNDCENAGNSACFDFGGEGMQTMILVGFGLVSAIRAYQFHAD